jgi:hypothetical protein
MPTRDIEDAVSNSIITLLETGRSVIEPAYIDLTPGESYKVFKDRQPQLTLASAGKLGPAIEVIRNKKTVEWRYTQVREETYSYWIDCSIKSLHKEAAQELVNTFASAVLTWMNQLQNLQYRIIGTNVVTYDSKAEDLDIEYRKGYGLYTGRINYWTKIINPAHIVFT